MIHTTPGRPFVVRDPVHGYLSVAAHERLVVDTPITQRLRRIGQTGLAEMVFPEAKTSRFVHSLGAMHLASRFVIAALENASREDVQSFFDDVRRELDWATLRAEDLDELLRHSGALDALSAIRFSGIPDSAQGKENRRLLALIEGALRLAALFHDLGHLPFSHDSEYALQDFASSREAAGKTLPPSTLAIANAKAPHEEIGHALADIVFRLLPESKPAARHVYSLAKKILDTPEPDYGMFKHQPASALQWLHSLVDGEIDVDRADYLLRDGQALGLDFAQYDLDRLVSSLVLIRTPERGYTTASMSLGSPHWRATASPVRGAIRCSFGTIKSAKWPRLSDMPPHDSWTRLRRLHYWTFCQSSRTSLRTKNGKLLFFNTRSSMTGGGFRPFEVFRHQRTKRCFPPVWRLHLIGHPSCGASGRGRVILRLTSSRLLESTSRVGPLLKREE